MRSAAACGARDRSAHPAGRGRDYEPVRGGFFAVIPSSGEVPPCATDATYVAGNAFYRSTEDVVAWDAENLLPELRDHPVRPRGVDVAG